MVTSLAGRITLGVVLVAVMALAFLMPAPAAAAPATSAWCSQWHTVGWGENLFRIGLRYGATTTYLQALNRLPNPHYIRYGEKLCVRTGFALPRGLWYTVRWGDTLFSIARRHGVSTWSLIHANRIPSPDRIYAGQVLWIP
jgi:LysM repeat protein